MELKLLGNEFLLEVGVVLGCRGTSLKPFKLWDLGFGGLGLRGFRVLGFRAWGLRFRV